MILPLLGESVAEFTVKTTHGVVTFPKDYEGKWMVLVIRVISHPFVQQNLLHFKRGMMNLENLTQN